MFRPNQDCIIYKSTENDVYGRQVLAGPIKERCTIVKAERFVQKSSVRADTSASRANARELDVDAVVLFTIFTVAQIDDIVELDDFKIRITGIIRRKDIHGVIDHYEATGTFWSE